MLKWKVWQVEHFGVSQRDPSSMAADSAEASATMRKAAGGFCLWFIASYDSLSWVVAPKSSKPLVSVCGWVPD